VVSYLDSCFDNHGTIREAQYLARAYTIHTNHPHYLLASQKALTAILTAQYTNNGGWAQYHPRRGGYSDSITFNDDLHIHLTTYLDLIRHGECPFEGVEWDSVSEEAGKASARALDLILDAQIVKCGRRTVWCAQHDVDTLEPVGGRDYEVASFSGYESQGVWRYLMELEDPSEGVRDAVLGAYEWFEGYQVVDWELSPNKKTLVRNNGVQQMARFYEINSYPIPQVIFCSRGCANDSNKKHTELFPFDQLNETYERVSEERRTGYSWLVRFPTSEMKLFERWNETYGIAPQPSVDGSPTPPPCTPGPTAVPSTSNPTEPGGLCDGMAYIRGEPCLDTVDVCEAVANLAVNGKESCDAWCGRSGLRCGSAWHDDGGTCTKKGVIGCDRTGASGSICRCEINTSPMVNISPTVVPSTLPPTTTASSTTNPTGAGGLCDTLLYIRGKPCLDTTATCEAVANLAANGKESCDAWCDRSGLRCGGAWHDDGGTCTKKSAIGCDRTGASGSICRCEVSIPTTVPPTTKNPTKYPTEGPTQSPTTNPTESPTTSNKPTSSEPTMVPSSNPNSDLCLSGTTTLITCKAIGCIWAKHECLMCTTYNKKSRNKCIKTGCNYDVSAAGDNKCWSCNVGKDKDECNGMSCIWKKVKTYGRICTPCAAITKRNKCKKAGCAYSKKKGCTSCVTKTKEEKCNTQKGCQWIEGKCSMDAYEQ